MQHLLLMIAIGIALALQASSDPSSVEDFIQSELKSSGLPGVSYAFIENGAVLSNAHGVTDLRTGSRRRTGYAVSDCFNIQKLHRGSHPSTR